MTQQIKDNVVVINEKDEFKYVSQITPANAVEIASPGHLNLLTFHC